MEIASIKEHFQALVGNSDLVNHFEFISGDDDGPYLNFMYGTTDPTALWQQIQVKIYENEEIGQAMKESSMAMCSSKERWDDYLLLFHFEPTVQDRRAKFLTSQPALCLGAQMGAIGGY
jgi:hypothetical protein